MMARSRHIYGPYEQRQLMHVDKAVDKEPSQGGLIALPSGAWYFLTHQGTGDWEGRAMCLLPVSWVDGWPLIGAIGADGIGNMVWSATKPIHGFPATAPQSCDEFDDQVLGPQWEWNYQPRAGTWSLSERPGWLRLHAFQPLRRNDFRSAGNTLSQRSMRTAHNVVAVKMDISQMTDGSRAGLCHFSFAYSTFGIVQSGTTRTLYYNNDGEETRGPQIHTGTIWLRSRWGFDGKSHYAYSLDGRRFTELGAPYQLRWGTYRGDRIGIYCFNDVDAGGFVDVDWLHYRIGHQTGR